MEFYEYTDDEIIQQILLKIHAEEQYYIEQYEKDVHNNLTNIKNEDKN